MNDHTRRRLIAYHRAKAKLCQRAAHRLFIRKQAEDDPERRQTIADQIERRFAEAERHTVWADAMRGSR